MPSIHIAIQTHCSVSITKKQEFERTTRERIKKSLLNIIELGLKKAQEISIFFHWGLSVDPDFKQGAIECRTTLSIKAERTKTVLDRVATSVLNLTINTYSNLLHSKPFGESWTIGLNEATSGFCMVK